VNDATSKKEFARDAAPAPREAPGGSARLTRTLLHAREAVMRQLRPHLRMHGLTEQQWRVLSELTTVTEIAASDLAASTCLRASSLSRIIKDLEYRGLIARRAQLEDLRRTLVSITQRGNNLLHQIEPVSAQIRADVAGRFGADRLDRLAELADDLVAACGGPQAGDDDGE